MRKIEKFSRLLKMANKCSNIKTCYSEDIKKWGENTNFDGIEVPKICPRFGKNKKNKIKVLFVGERPGRMGTGKSGKIAPCNDDPSAEFFRKCFHKKLRPAGIELENIVFTNACLCRPILRGDFSQQLGSCNGCKSSDIYRDKAPKSKVDRCMEEWFNKQLDILEPEFIVTLGNSALIGLKKIFSKELKGVTLARHIQRLQPKPIQIDNGKYKVYPMYHTSAQVRRTRPDPERLNDWKKLAKVLKNSKK